MEFFCPSPREMRSKRLHIVVPSVLFAILMWISINLAEEYQVSMEIPLVVANVPEGMALNRPVPKSLIMKVRGSGWRLASFFFSGKPGCVLDVTELGARQTVMTKFNLLDHLFLTVGIHPVDVNLDTLVLSYENRVERKVRVRSNVYVECADGYGIVGSISVRPESISVSGAESVVRSLEYWRTQERIFSSVRTSFDREVPLEDSQVYSIQVMQKSVQVSATIQPLAEKVFSGVIVEVLSIPLNREIVFIPPRIDVVVRGGVDQLAAFGASDVRAFVDYATLIVDTTGFIQPRIEVPPEVRLLAKRPERLQYVIRRRL
jgi:hypothetical protein